MECLDRRAKGAPFKSADVLQWTTSEDDDARTLKAFLGGAAAELTTKGITRKLRASADAPTLVDDGAVWTLRATRLSHARLTQFVIKKAEARAEMTQPRLESGGAPRASKAASIIYAPAGQAGEYAPLATNPYRGCGHKCAYCYVPRRRCRHGPRRVRRRRDLRPDFSQDGLRTRGRYRGMASPSRCMLCFSTDPYPPAHTSRRAQALEILIEHGLAFCTLTKGGTRALRDIDLFRPDRDAFASTLTSLDASLLAQVGTRRRLIRTTGLRRCAPFIERGIFTWVSLEPTLDVEAVARHRRRHARVRRPLQGRACQLCRPHARRPTGAITPCA